MHGCMPSATKVCWNKGRLHQGVVPEVQYFSVLVGRRQGMQVSLAALVAFRIGTARPMVCTFVGGVCWHGCLTSGGRPTGPWGIVGCITLDFTGRHLIQGSQAYLAGS